MKYYIYHNVTGLIEAGGGEDQARVDAQAATKPAWDVIALDRSIRGQVRVDIPGLFLRAWTQQEINDKAAIDQAAKDKANGTRGRARVVHGAGMAGGLPVLYSIVDDMLEIMDRKGMLNDE